MTDRQTDRETGIERDRQTDSQKDRQTDRQKEREHTEREVGDRAEMGKEGRWDGETY